MEIVPSSSKSPEYQESSRSGSFRGIKFIIDSSIISKTYLFEVKENIEKDFGEIQAEFEFERENIESISIVRAGDETHFGGKVPLFLTFKIKDKGDLRLVYKPRSLEPEKILEEVLSKINHIPSRKILNCQDHGYDSFIEGKHLLHQDLNQPLKGVAFSSTICALCNQSELNRNLILTLKYLGFEDIHAQNFILDKNDVLHFIDAEVYQTKVAVNVDDIYNCKEYMQAKFPKDIGVEEKIKKIASGKSEELKRVPTRLVICSTQIYKFPLAILIPDQFIIGECKLEGLSNDFRDYHTACLAQFLFKNRFIDVFKGINLKQIKVIINGAFIEDNALDKINAELDEADKLKDKKELPAFSFHLTEKWIKCPLTNTKLHLKRGG